MAPVNITSIKATSDGVFQGENPLHYAFPLLIVQTTLIIVVSRVLAFFFKPLRQPKVIAEIVGGILLGPSALGRSTAYLQAVFPKWSLPILDSVANLGLLFFLFLVGLELDLTSIRRGGRKALLISVAGIALPFASGAGVAVLFRRAIAGADKVGYGQFLVFMGVALSITAFPVLARILAELKLLTTRVGELAMSAAAFDDVSAWILLALAIALAGSGSGSGTHKSPIVSLWVLLCGVVFVTVMFLVVRPVMARVARRCSAEPSGAASETYIALTLAGVLASGFLTDFIGIHAIFGGFVFGLVIPKEGAFAGKLIERIEDFVSGLMLPLYFASSGLKTNVATIKGAEAWGLLALVIAVACAGKIIAVTTVALACKIPTRESITLGFLMNTKGLVELIVLNIGKEKKVLNDEMFAIMVLMALVTTFMTTPIVMAIYKPARRGATTASSAYSRKLHGCTDTDLHVLACLHGPGNVPAVVRLVESLRAPAGKSSGRLKLYAMRLFELTERSSSIVMAQRLRRRNALPFRNRGGRPEEGGTDLVHDRLVNSFRAYGQPGGGSRITVRPVTTVSPLPTMHEDVCQVAEEKEVAIIVLPFHKAWQLAEDDAVMKVESVGHEWRGVNQKVMRHAPCSVAVLVDRGFGVSTLKAEAEEEDGREKVGVVFFGGPDDREALELGRRMADNVAAMKVEVVRFVDKEGSDPDGNRIMPSPEKPPESSYTFSVAVMNRAAERELDNAAVAEFRRRCEGTALYTEQVAENVVKDVLSIAHSGGYDLIVVGKGRFPSTAMVAGLADLQAEHAELGPIGDILTSSTSGVMSSVLVAQQHSVSPNEDVPFSKVLHADV